MKQIVPISFALSFFITIIGALAKIMHWSFSQPLLILGLLSLVVFVVMSIYEIVNSTKIKRSELVMWIVGFLFFAHITGLVYVLSARQRITNLK
jgi:predicted membrane channel-forming protein YqfA (hemolysin III family)